MKHATLDKPAPYAEPPHRRRGNPWVKGVLAVVCFGMVAMWIYGFFFASKQAAYRVADAAWRANAQEVCGQFEAQRLKLVDTSEGYIAHPTNDQMLQRADLVEQATDILQSELDAITSFPVATDRDRQIIEDYRGFYDSLISDRRDYIAQLRRFDLQPYSETEVGGGPVTNIILDFTTVNQIDKCEPPGELGGDV